MKRLLIFSHYNCHDQLSGYVLHWLRELQPLFANVIFVSNSKLNEEARNQVAGFAHQTLVRENTGFDFGAWKEAMSVAGWDVLATYDSVTLMNDSCFGPLFPLCDVYRRMENQDIDFWGITRHPYYRPGQMLRTKPIPEHIQSFFMVYNSNVIASPAFGEFWERVKEHTTKRVLVQRYETDLTRHLAKAGFKYTAELEHLETPSSEPNLSIFHPDLLIKNRSPFLKIKSFFYTEHPAYLKKIIAEKSDYDGSLIDAHFNHNLPPNQSVNITDNKLWVNSSFRPHREGAQHVAIHFHVYYLEVFLRHLAALQQSNCAFDLFITTDTEEKKAKIATLFDPGATSPALKEVFVFENIGRDVLPWMNISEKLAGYNVVGHFHTKKSATTKEWIGALWMDEMVDTLIRPMNEIIDAFEQEKDLGVVIPDVPVFFKRTSVVPGWNNTKDTAMSLWNAMSLKKKLSFDNLHSSIMPYGTMFWYRPEAIEPLLNLDLSAEDFPGEPMPGGGTLAHAIESLPVFVAWGQGYTYKVAIHPDYVLSGFDTSAMVRLAEIQDLLFRSPTWRIGRLFTWLPGKIRDLLLRENQNGEA